MLTEQQRYDIAQRYLQAAEQVVAKVTNLDAHAVADFLRTVSCLTYPKQDRAFHKGRPLRRVFAGVEGSHWLWVYVFHKADLVYLPRDCAKTLGLQSGPRGLGTYYHKNRFLVLSAELDYSPVFTGLILLHEGFHAWSQQVRGVDGRTCNHDPHEHETHSFIHALLQEYGGESYNFLLRQRMEELRQELLGRAIGPVGDFKEPVYPRVFDSLFGPARNVDERHLRKATLLRHAVFQLVREKNLPLSEQLAELHPLL